MEISLSFNCGIVIERLPEDGFGKIEKEKSFVGSFLIPSARHKSCEFMVCTLAERESLILATKGKSETRGIKNVFRRGFAFAKVNYHIMLAGVALITIGFLVMAGGGSDDPNIFNPEVFSFRRITLAPIFILSGFATVIVAIMKKSKE